MVMTPMGNTATDSEKGLLPNENLNDKSRELDILPDLKHNSLLSVCKLVDAGYTTIFHPYDGVLIVHSSEDIFDKGRKRRSPTRVER